MELPSTPLTLALDAQSYPVQILKRHVAVGATVSKTQPLVTFAYTSHTPLANGLTGEATSERQVNVWESPVQGICSSWHVKEGDTLHDARNPIVFIQEPCTHDVQLHGLCAICGKDLTQIDYTGFSDTSRAGISMAHDSGGLTVSMEEANRLETATAERLHKSRKLSLIVDLDQTIIQAAVDPTVGEWLQDPTNPNYAALQGTEKFMLGENSDESADDGCWYYIKMRPGLQQFLQDVATMYEMHVYTMGTRAYAREVCKIIDPDGGLFGGRILSRDESGSMTRKSLQRLFPCHQNMVVIIDDRADVWNDIPNLVKVVPYEFFVGIGDINAAFLPKKKELVGASGPGPTSKSDPLPSTLAQPEADADDPSAPEVSVSDTTIISPPISEASASVAATIHDQIENRPLSKTQGVTNAGDDESEVEEQEAVLKNDDNELERVYEILKNVRDKFYDAGLKNPDVRDILPSMKRRVLKGTHIVFSGVVALGSRPQDSEHWKLATAFGAKCSADLDGSTTHVVASQNGTAKVHKARRDPQIHIVWTKWLLDSIALWKRQAEPNYHIEDPSVPYVPVASTSTLPPDMPSDPPSPASSSFGEVAETDMRALDWEAAMNEVDDLLNETDDDETDDGNVSDASSVSANSPANGAGRGGPNKRPRAASDSDDDGSQKAGDLMVASPLQKRVRSSRNRKSRLKVSFPPGEGDEEGVDGAPAAQGADSSEVATPSSPTEGSPVPSPGNSSNVGGSVDSKEDEEDDDDFIASMAADLEQGWA